MQPIDASLIVPVPVSSPEESISFFCAFLGIATVAHRAEGLVDLALRDAPAAILRCDTDPLPHYSGFRAFIFVPNARTLFERIEREWAGGDWGIYEAFFGRYLATPVGDQFAVASSAGGLLLFTDGRTERVAADATDVIGDV